MEPHRPGAALARSALLSDDPQMITIASRFGDTGKPIWRHFADVPGVNTRVNMRHHRLVYLLLPVFLTVVGALIIRQVSLREEAKPVVIEDKSSVAREEKPPVAMEEKAPWSISQKWLVRRPMSLAAKNVKRNYGVQPIYSDLL